MSRPKSTPSYCLHKRSGRAYCTVEGVEHWLGVYDSPESRAEYDRIIGEWLVNGRCAPEISGITGTTVSSILAAFLAHAKTYYIAPAVNVDGSTRLVDGKPVLAPSRECENYIEAMRPMRRLYGAIPAIAFGPKAFKVVREDLIKSGLCRNVINRRMARIKQIFKWSVSNELIPPSVFQSLATVAGLRNGYTNARESKPVRAVHPDQVAAVLEFLSPQLQAMVKLQMLTGMRSGELFIMRTADVDTTAATWNYHPTHHKTSHHGFDRNIPLGPQAREILKPYLKPDLTAFIFSPADASEQARAARASNRKTPPGQGNAAGTNRKARPKRKPHRRYCSASYRRAIARACEKAFKMPADIREPTAKRAMAKDTPAAKAERRAARIAWREANVFHPHQLRHTAATRIRKDFGLDAARAVLGQRSEAVAAVYAERDKTQAEMIMAKIG